MNGKILKAVFGGVCIGILGVLLALGGCVTGADEPDPSGSEPTHYTLAIGAKVPAPAPLPQQTKILVEWHFKNGATRKLEGFRGWNLNHDERFEMVEVLAEDGSVLAQVFDYDSDGRIDEIKEK